MNHKTLFALAVCSAVLVACGEQSAVQLDVAAPGTGSAAPTAFVAPSAPAAEPAAAPQAAQATAAPSAAQKSDEAGKFDEHESEGGKKPE